MVLDDEGQYNNLRQKAVQQLYVASEGQVIQPPTAIVGQVCKKYVCILNHHH
jgi:hypothetical protein